MMKRIVLLIVACLSTWAMSSCSKEGPEDNNGFVIWDIGSPMLVFDLRSEQGDDLLAEDNVAREELLKSIQLRCDGKVYPLVISDKPVKGELRHLPAFFSGFHFAPMMSDDHGTPKLMFGQLVGYTDKTHRIEFVWPNGKTEVIVYTNKVYNKGTKDLKIDRVFTLNGKVIPGEDIKLVQPTQP